MNDPTPPRQAGPTDATVHLCHGVAWPGRVPHLVLTDVDTDARTAIPLLGHHLGLRAWSPDRYCTGRLVLDGPAKGVVACPGSRRAASGAQCEDCAARDDFRFAHHYHRGGYAPPGLAVYMSQRHWVYIATFADATSKVGTAASGRKTERLDEQGAVRATYVAHVPDGALARVFEDAISSGLGIVQAKRRAAKTAALAAPADRARIEDAHLAAVARASDLLRTERDRAGVDLPNEDWAPPAAMAGFFHGSPRGGWATYPHDLRAGEHGLFVEAVSGPAVLVRLTNDPDEPALVADLGALKGRRVATGAYVSPPTHVQTGLF